jgi:hypothetical protein
LSDRTGEGQEHPSKLILDRMACDEFSEEEENKLRSHMDTCSECSAYYMSVTDNSVCITDRYPQLVNLKRKYHPFKDPVSSRIRNALLSYVTPLRGVLAFGACALFCLVVYWGSFTGNDPRLTVKGKPQWFLYTGGSLFSTADKVIMVESGDSLQLLMRLSSPVYYHLLYRDDNSPVNRYCCDESKMLEPRADGKKVSLPFSIVLDSLWQRQTLFCIASSKPLQPKEAERLIDNGKGARTRSDIWIHTFHLYNEIDK